MNNPLNTFSVFLNSIFGNAWPVQTTKTVDEYRLTLVTFVSRSRFPGNPITFCLVSSFFDSYFLGALALHR